MSSTTLIIISLVAWAGFWFCLGVAMARLAGAANARADRELEERRVADLHYTPTPAGLAYAKQLRNMRVGR